MSNLCKQYMKDVKAFFPVIGKQEKEYLRRLEEHVKDYCEDETVSSVEDLYTGFGTPAEVLNTYYSTVDTKHVLSQVTKAHYAKILFVILISATLIVTSIYCGIRLAEYSDFKKENIFLKKLSLNSRRSL